jgi:hypothetical protein
MCLSLHLVPQMVTFLEYSSSHVPCANLSQEQKRVSFDVQLEVALTPAGSPTSTVVTRTNLRHLCGACPASLRIACNASSSSCLHVHKAHLGLPPPLVQA